MINKLAIVTCSSWLLSLTAWSQDLRFQHLGIADGLSQSTVFAMLQDHTGFMWFGTNDGLNRYDGYSFRHYLHSAGASDSLSDSWVSALCEDQTGTLWVGTYGYGLNRLRPDGRFERVDLGLKDVGRGLGQNLVTGLVEVEPGVLWVGLQSHGIAVVREGKLSHHPGRELGLPSTNVRALGRSRDGGAWIATDQGLARFLPAANRIQAIEGLAEDGSRPELIDVLYEDGEGRLWIGTVAQGLYLRHPNGRLRHLAGEGSPGHVGIKALLAGREGELWIGTAKSGLYNLSIGAGRFVQYRAHYGDPDSLRDNVIYSLCQDRSGQIWVGTYAEGLSRFNPSLQGFHHIRAYPEKENSLAGNFVTSFAWDEGKLWMGTRHAGLDLYDPASGSFTHFTNRPGGLSSNEIRHVCRDSQGIVWVGTENGLNRIDKRRAISHFLPDGRPGSLNARSVMQVVEDGADLWVATYEGGLNHFDRKTLRFKAFTYDPKNLTSLSNNYVNCVFVDGEQQLWVGTEDGLDHMDRTTGSFVRYSAVDERHPNGLRHPSVMSIFQRAGERHLWIGTYGGGLHRFDPSLGTFEVFTTHEGLANDAIYGIVDDALGRLWISTNGGISRFHPETGEFRTYDNNNGLPRNEFNRGAYFRAPNGQLYFGGYGVVVFDPLKIKPNTYVPPIVLTGITVGDRPLALTAPLGQLEELRLPYDHHVLSLSFAALDFNSPARNRFATLLEGVFDDWVQLEGRHEVTYTALSPGSYRLHIKGSNNDGLFNEEGLILPIVVTPPIWQTRQAYLFYAVIAIVLGILLWRARVRAQNQELERAMSIGKAEFATTVLHNIGNVLNSVRVSCDKTAGIMRASKVRPLLRALDLLSENLEHIDTYLKSDPRGKLLPGYFKSAGELVTEEYREMLAECDEMAEQISLMKDIIETQQAHASIQLADEAHNLNEVVRDALRVQDSGLRQRGVQVEERLRPLPPVNVPKTQLMHIIINLLKNAREAMDQNGEREKRLILESGRYGDTEVYLKISDTGVGISRENLAKMFTYGFTTKPSGHGFGLNYCSRTMRELGGSIEVESDGLGKGASFTLLFRTEGQV